MVLASESNTKFHFSTSFDQESLKLEHGKGWQEEAAEIQAQVVQGIHWINHYPLDNTIILLCTYAQNIGLYSGQC